MAAAESRASSSALALKQTVFENTFNIGPLERERFRPHRVQRLLRELLAERLAGQAYDPVRGPQLCKQLADDVREGVKALDYERYKLIVQVTLGEKHGQTFHAASRCLWDSGADGHASETYQSTTLFCNCQVYALYFE